MRPEDPAAIVGPRPRGSRRPRTDATVAAVRRLIEQTALTYGEIATRTGVGRATICRWPRDGGWMRHPFAPRATDTVPTARGSARLKRRTLAARFSALAERYMRELEETPGVDLEKLAAALELMKMAKLAARPRKRKRRPGDLDLDFSAATGERLRPIMQLVAADVDLHRAPRAALEDFLAHREPPPKESLPRRSRAWRFKRPEYHAWLLEKEEKKEEEKQKEKELLSSPN